MKLRNSLIALTLGLLSSAGAWASSDSPAGTWKTIDDHTHQPKSIVQITEQDGKLQGKILEILQSDEGPHPVCKKCEGALKDQPIEGMVILKDVRKNGEVWDGGTIFDPKEAKTYKVKLSLKDDGNKLDVRGYIGFSLIGRSQIWERMPD